MTERQAIESTYWDTYSIYRRDREKNTLTRQTEQTEACVAAGLPCALSRGKSGEIGFREAHGQYAGSYVLFCAPQTPALPGDRLEITTGAGQQFSLWMGRPFVYASHAEIPLSEEERA